MNFASVPLIMLSMFTSPPLILMLIQDKAQTIVTAQAPMQRESPILTPYTLTWSDRKLLVSIDDSSESIFLPVVNDENHLVECLKRSPVESIRLDANLSPEILLRWAEACGQARKECYVMLPSVPETLNKPNPVLCFLYKSIHRITAIILAVMLLPALLLVVTAFNSSILRLHKQWVVGSRGRLFQIWVCQEVPPSSGYLSPIQSVVLKLANAMQGEMLLSTPMPTSLVQFL